MGPVWRPKRIYLTCPGQLWLEARGRLWQKWDAGTRQGVLDGTFFCSSFTRQIRYLLEPAKSLPNSLCIRKWEHQLVKPKKPRQGSILSDVCSPLPSLLPRYLQDSSKMLPRCFQELPRFG